MFREKMLWRVIRWIILTMFALWTVIPISIVILTSFKSQIDIFQVPFKVFFIPTMVNYSKAFSSGEFFAYFINTVIISAISSVISVGFGVLAAYGLVKFNLKSSGLISNIFLIGKLVPSITILIPLFAIITKVGLLGTYIGPILAHVAINLPFVVWLMISFIKDIPDDLSASSLIDGCTKMQTFWKIIFPILTPAIASAAILSMQLSWNEFIFSLQLTNLNTSTLPVGIAKFVGSVSVDWGKSCAAATFTMVPIIIAGFFVQRYIVTGMTMGSVKG